MNKNIHELGLKHGTDKISVHGYDRYYQQVFENLQDKKLNLLEIGIYYGSSIKLWHEFFENANIYGIDIDNKDHLNLQNNRTKFFYGNQSDINFLQNFIKLVEPLDIVIDDGGHVSKELIVSFEVLFPSLNSGGIYIIEDIYTSYLNRWGWGGDESNFNNPNTTVGYFKNIIDSLNFRDDVFRLPNYSPHPYYRMIDYVTFYKSMLLVKKV